MEKSEKMTQLLFTPSAVRLASNPSRETGYPFRITWFPHSLQENWCIVRRRGHSHLLQPATHQLAGYRRHIDVLHLRINKKSVKNPRQVEAEGLGRTKTHTSHLPKMFQRDQIASKIPNTFSVRKNDESCLRSNDCSPECDCSVRNVLRSWTRYVARMGERRGSDRFSVGKPQAKRPLGRPRR